MTPVGTDGTGIERTITRLVIQELNIDPVRMGRDTNLRELPGIESIRLLRIDIRAGANLRCRAGGQVVFTVSTLGELADAIRALCEPAAAK